MMAVLLAGLLAGFYSLPVAATEQAADAQTELKLADVDVERFLTLIQLRIREVLCCR